jgi:hypothetical protein
LRGPEPLRLQRDNRFKSHKSMQDLGRLVGACFNRMLTLEQDFWWQIDVTTS